VIAPFAGLLDVFERLRPRKTAAKGAQNAVGGWVVAVAGLLWAALVLYPLSLTELREPLVPLAVGSALSMGALLGTGRWAFAVAAASLWIVEYASALVLSARTDWAAPVLGVVCWLTLELVDWQRLSAPEVRHSAAHASISGAVGGAGAIACLGAGLVVEGTVPLLVAVGAGAGIAVLSMAVALARGALGDDLFTTTGAPRGSG
jgi:hypothetical protein